MPQSLLLPAEGLLSNLQIQVTPALNSPRGAAPWTIAFLAAVAHGWDMP